MTTDAPDHDDRTAPAEIISTALPPLTGHDRRASLDALRLEARAKYEMLRAERLARGGRFDRI